MLVQAGSGVAGIASASSEGVPASFARETVVVPYNDAAAAKEAAAEFGPQLAAIIVEPIAANMGLVLPQPGFLLLLRELCDASGALLIFDEVITGFRLTFGGYQQLCGIKPDLTCLGKIIGGGLPIGALGGRADVMEQLAPLGGVYQAGTLSGNPVSVAAGLALLHLLRDNPPYETLAARTADFTGELRALAKTAGLALQIPAVASMFSFFFMTKEPASFEETQAADRKLFAALFRELLAGGVYLPPSPFEVSFLSAAHDDAVLEQALKAFKPALGALAVASGAAQ